LASELPQADVVARPSPAAFLREISARRCAGWNFRPRT